MDRSSESLTGSPEGNSARDCKSLGAWPDTIGPGHAPRKLAFPPRSEGIVARASEEQFFFLLWRESQTGEGEFLGVGSGWEHAQVQTMCWRLFQTAGKIVRHGRQVFLKISAAMLEMFAAIRERCTRVMREGGAVPETS
jgi:hypothetical protein